MTKIEWAERSWNPITGCTPISEGCANCYAKKFADRLGAMGIYDSRKPFAVRMWPKRMNEPYTWKYPSRVFVCSMGDLFHEDVDDHAIDTVINTAEALGRHTWMVLTKRPERMAQYFLRRPVPATMWLGATVENQRAVNTRLDALTSIRTSRLWVSAEPLLQPISMTKYLGLSYDRRPTSPPTVGWVVCGAESGSGRRVFREEWARHLKEQCVAAGVPFFYKKGPVSGQKHPVSLPILDGKRWEQYPMIDVTGVAA